MGEATGISLDHFRVLVEQARLNLSSEELASLKPMYDFYVAQVQRLHELDLGAEDLAVVFPPVWDAQG